MTAKQRGMVMRMILGALLFALCMLGLQTWQSTPAEVRAAELRVQDCEPVPCAFCSSCPCVAICITTLPSPQHHFLPSETASSCLLTFPSHPSYNSQPSISGPCWQFRTHSDGVTHVLVTGGAGFIGSHATLLLLENGFRVTIVVSEESRETVVASAGLSGYSSECFIQSDNSRECGIQCGNCSE